MTPKSIFNDVLGPVTRGPSSSHTAGPFFIGRMARSLLGGVPGRVRFTFDPNGSFAAVYREQGSDLGFAAGVMGWAITDERFSQALVVAAEQGLDVAFCVEPLAHAGHPNTVAIEMSSTAGRELRARATSTGGGAVVFTELDGWPVRLAGDAYHVLAEVEEEVAPGVGAALGADSTALSKSARRGRDGCVLLHVSRGSPLPVEPMELEREAGVRRVWATPPIRFVPSGRPLFASAAEMVAWAEGARSSLGQAGLRYEAAVLRWRESEVLAEMTRRFDVMADAVRSGLRDPLPPMQLLSPSARAIFRAESQKRVAVGGMSTRAAARALAVMHVNGSMGMVCAAPTGGSAGVLPGALVTLAEERALSRDGIAMALLAAGAVGLVLANRATFAAEVAGCQVEIGAAGAMAAAAVVEAVGGTARHAADAAAIALQNTMGSICDPVQGTVEIPCHTRNAAAASSAFVCADLILGGYENPIPLDETIDAVYAVGQLLPRELKCTALGGLAVTPSALAMERRGR